MGRPHPGWDGGGVTLPLLFLTPILALKSVVWGCRPKSARADYDGSRITILAVPPPLDDTPRRNAEGRVIYPMTKVRCKIRRLQ